MRMLGKNIADYVYQGSLRRRIVFGLLLVLLIGSLGIGGGAIKYGFNLIEQRVHQQMLSVLQLKKFYISSLLRQRELEMKMFIKENESDICLKALSHGDKHKDIRISLSNFANNWDEIEETFVIGMGGEVLVSSDDLQEGKSKINEEYFLRGKEGLFVQNFIYDVSVRKISMIISMPIKQDENTKCVYAERLNLDTLSSLMNQRNGLGDKGETYLVNKFNYFVTQPLFAKKAVMNKTVHSEGVEACLNGYSGFKRYRNYDNQKVYGVFEWYPKLDSCLVGEINRQEIFQALIFLVLWVFFSVMIFNMAVVFLVYHYIDKFVGPIEKLTETVEKIGSGDFDVKIPEGCVDEIGRLSVAFNLMRLKLKKSYSLLKNDNVKLKRLDKSKDEFFNITAHELKTPLTTVLALSGLLINFKHCPEEKKLIRCIYNEALRFKKIVNQISTITRYETDKKEIECSCFFMVDVLWGLKKKFDVLVKKNGSKVKIGFYKTKLFIKTDRQLVEQVIVDFFENAIKYGHDGQEITIGCQKYGVNKVRVFVKDQGPGIKKTDQKKIFDKFFQKEPSFVRSQDGLGLGLYIDRLIVERLGGKIGVKSSKGNGAEFYFILPVNCQKKKK